MKRGLIAGFALLALFFSVFAFAQTETGAITGTITDPTGAVIAKATVTARETATGAVRTTVADGNGIYAITNLPPSAYEVSVEAPGMSKTTERVQVAVGAKLGLNFKMQVGAASTTVEVQASGTGTQVNTETQEIGTQITTQEVMQLPTLDRNPYSLVATAAGVSEDDPSGRGTGFSINGLRSSGTSVLLDGAANNDEFVAAVGQPVPLDSLQEFSVLTNSFGAEYGRAGAGVVNVVTKSGSNNWHGSAYEVGRWSGISANTYYNNANDIKKPVFTRNNFGGSFGGPIIKDKLFFFFNPEWVRVRSGEVDTGVVVDPGFLSDLTGGGATYTVPFFTKYGTPRAGLKTLAPISLANSGFCTSTACQTFGAGLSPNGMNTTAFDTVAWIAPGDAGGGYPQNTYDILGRVDYNISNKTSFYSRYAVYKEVDMPGSVNTSPYVGYDTGAIGHDQNILLSLTHTLSPTLTEQTKFVYNRLLTIQPLGSQPVSPTLYMNTSGPLASVSGTPVYLPGYSATSPSTAIPFGGPQNFYQTYEDVSLVHGKHNFRFGGSLTFLLDNRTFGAYEEGIEDLGGNNASTGLDNLLAGNMYDFTAAIYPQGKFPCPGGIQTPQCTISLPVGPPNFSRSNHYTEMGFYGEDSWKVSPRFTLNLGIRWEYFGVQHDKNPLMDSNFYLGGGGTLQQQIANGAVSQTGASPVGGLWKKDLKDFAPRLGFAWDVFGDGKTAFRGGWGIAYERNFGNVTFNVEFNPPNYAVVTLPGSLAGPISTQNYGPLSGTSGSAALPASSLRWVDQNMPTAYAHLFSATLEHQFGNHVLAGIDYSGSKGVHQYSLTNFNQCGAGQVFLNQPFVTPGAPSECDPYGLGWTRLNTQYATMNARRADGSSLYNAAIFRLNLNNLAKTGLTLNANYTYSLAEDDLSDTESSSGNNVNLGYTDPFNPKLDWGPSQYSNRHRVAISGVWAIPYAKDTHGALKEVLDGWVMSPIFTARSGVPFTIGDYTNAMYVAPRVALLGAVPRRTLSTPVNLGGDTFNVYNMPASSLIDESYVNPILGVSDFGPWSPNMTGRDTFTSMGSWNMNLGLYKSFFVGEKFKLQLRAEMFDVFNHANLAMYGTSAYIYGPYNEMITGEKGPNLSQGGYYPNVTNPARTVQATLRLDF
ncbi:MAG: carboxypeptidase regulatory-like domain-containing protein [Terriglobales bacterium]|jgi:outer membrane receptor protein involved in Fe transport